MSDRRPGLGDHVLHEREAPQDTVRPTESPSKQASGDSDSAGDHVPPRIQPAEKPDQVCPPHDPEIIGTTHAVCRRCGAVGRLRHG